MVLNFLQVRLLYNKYFYISTTVGIIILFNLIAFSGVLEQSTSSICLFGDFTLNLEKDTFKILKLIYFIFTLVSSGFLSFVFFTKNTKLYKNSSDTYLDDKNPDELSLKIGVSKEDNSNVYIHEKGLYQNILITGTIGTGKTSSAMYPFLDQLLEQGLGMLILDVKGNFYKKVLELNQLYKRNVIVIELNGKYKYNPLDKPNLKPSVLANRLKTILMLFSNQNTSDSYWLDKVEIYLTECIKLCRLYNDGYVTNKQL